MPSGLLYYTQSEEIMRVMTPRNELKGLIMARNELASYMMRKRVGRIAGEGSGGPTGRPFLPPTLDDDYKCSKCYVVDGCMLYRKVLYFAPPDTCLNTYSSTADRQLKAWKTPRVPSPHSTRRKLRTLHPHSATSSKSGRRWCPWRSKTLSVSERSSGR